MNTISKIFSILPQKDIHRCWLLGFAMLLGACLEAMGIGAILPLISVMSQPDYLKNHESVSFFVSMFGVSTHTELIMFGAVSLLLLYILKNGYLVCLAKWQIDFSIGLQVRYARQLYANYLLKPYIFHLAHNTAMLLRNTYDGPVRVFSEIFIYALMLLTELLAIIVIWCMLAFVDIYAAVFVGLGLGGIICGILKLFRRRIIRQGEIRNHYAAVMYQWVNQGLGAIKEAKVLGREQHFYEAYSAAYEKFGEAYRTYRFFNQLPRYIIEGLAVGGLLFLVIGKLLLGSNISNIASVLGVLTLAAFRMMPSANRIVNEWNVIKFNLPIFEELCDEFLVIRNRIAKGEDKNVFSSKKWRLPFKRNIQISHLCFRYPDRHQDVLRDISFVIPKGSFMGIIGPSGAGKTTFVDLLLGLLEPTAGDIAVDGVSIYDDKRAWQENLAYVPQEIYLIDGTLRENIALGFVGEQIDDSQVEKVLRMAELDAFVHSLPQGLYTTVGERGVKLSGGQRQRIGIARALYAMPDVLVLDEATSALDDATEKSITDTILKLKGAITIVAIAHRTTTLKDCDFKIRFEKGVVIKE